MSPARRERATFIHLMLAHTMQQPRGSLLVLLVVVVVAVAALMADSCSAAPPPVLVRSGLGRHSWSIRFLTSMMCGQTQFTSSLAIYTTDWLNGTVQYDGPNKNSREYVCTVV